MLGMRAPLPTPHPPIRQPFQVVVHNLPWECSNEELKSAFCNWNPQQADIALDALGRSRCARRCSCSGLRVGEPGEAQLRGFFQDPAQDRNPARC